MCYSAQIEADYKRYVRDFGALLSIKEFYDLFWRRNEDSKIKIPKGMEKLSWTRRTRTVRKSRR